MDEAEKRAAGIVVASAPGVGGCRWCAQLEPR